MKHHQPEKLLAVSATVATARSAAAVVSQLMLLQEESE